LTIAKEKDAERDRLYIELLRQAENTRKRERNEIENEQTDQYGNNDERSIQREEKKLIDLQMEEQRLREEAQQMRIEKEKQYHQQNNKRKELEENTLASLRPKNRNKNATKAAGIAAERIVECAKQKGSGDNITALVVYY